MEFIDLKSQQKLIRSNILKRLNIVLDHGQYIMGPEVFELENSLAENVGVKYCISCSSGTDALLIILMANGIGEGDAVLTTPFTYIATSEAISLAGATPVYVDINEKTFNMDPNKIEDSIKIAKNKNLKPKAIMPVDLFGLPARYRMIDDISKKNNLIVIEDAAQSYGGSIRGKKSCSFGSAAATSFFPAKPLGCYGDGGAIFTNLDHIAEKARSIRVHGQGFDKYQNIRLGLNGRMDTIQAAILLEKIKIYSTEMEKRETIAKNYYLNIIDSYSIQYIPKMYRTSWAQFSIVVPEDINRSDVSEKLKQNNIPSNVYYPISSHLQRAYSDLGYEKGSFPISEEISKRIISIPMHAYLNEDDQERIIKTLNNI